MEKNKFLSSGFSTNFIINVIEYFYKNKVDLIIPEWLFDKQKSIF